MKFRVFALAALSAAVALLLGACSGAAGGPDQQQASPAGGGDAESAKGAGISLVAAQQEPFVADSAWVATFQLCWNKLLDEFNAGQPVRFEQGNGEQADALNERSFDASMLSEDHYYTYAGKGSVSAKEEIERAIKEKFDQESDILDQFEWDPSDETDLRFTYAMLYRKFTFGKAFDVVREDAATFGSADNGNAADGVAYFGCDAESDEQLRDQVQVLYYDGPQSHAVSLPTEQGDRLVLVKGPQGATVDEVFANAMDKAGAFTGTPRLRPVDTLAVPDLSVDEIAEFKELEDKSWTAPDGTDYEISKAVETLKLTLDKKGGEVKSEAGIMMKATSIATSEPEEDPRDFSYDDDFALFLIDDSAQSALEGEGGLAGQHPYLALHVHDVTKFQQGTRLL